MSIPAAYEKQVKSILKNVADLKNFIAATEIYFKESSALLKDMMEKSGVEYNPDIENLRLPFQDEQLSYAFTNLITQLLEYEKSYSFFNGKIGEFDRHTARHLSEVFDKEESSQARNQVINEIVENLEILVEEKQNIVRQTVEIEQTIKQLETRLSTYFN
jgi:hypothetical protein